MLAVIGPLAMASKNGSWAPLREEFVWPNVFYPTTKILYLDLNHFINLARLIVKPGRALPGYAALLESLRRAIQERRVVVPLGE